MADDDNEKLILLVEKQAREQVREQMEALPAEVISMDDLELALLRCQVAYMGDQQKRPLEQFYHHVQEVMTWEDLARRAREQRWQENRERIWASAQRQLANAIGQRVTKDRMEELRELEIVRRHFLHLIMPYEIEDEETGEKRLEWRTQPKSLGEAVRAFKDLHLLLEVSRSNVLVDVNQMAPEPDTAIEDDSDVFSRQELAIFARTVLRRRVGKMLEDDGDDE